MSEPPNTKRERAADAFEELKRWKAEPGSVRLHEPMRQFLEDLCASFLTASDEALESVAATRAKIEASNSLSPEAKEAYLWLLKSWPTEDATGRLNIRTLVCSGLVGKAPEAPRNTGSTRRVAGRDVPKPNFGGGFQPGMPTKPT